MDYKRDRDFVAQSNADDNKNMGIGRMDVIETGVLMGVLFISSIEDIRRRRVNLILLIVSGIVAVFFHMCWNSHSLMDMLEGALVGVVLLICSKLTKGRIGVGDGLMLVVTGLFLGWQKNAALFFLGTMMAGLYSLLLFSLKRKRKDDEIAFIPFLSIGYLIVCILETGVFG